eukprot:TRINITY_DN103764_c0_g1_i1.p1 TRINITY_DN103764_c0_g1~~TRINITY_DN103764_c0_g1_i1.p1  ORF type:complete len:634 (+),score=153.34 TRINITY_DN103764_c0_g1_i1:47-1948(+)
MVATAAGPTMAPANIEDFLWNIHSVLVGAEGVVQLDSLRDEYLKQLGHKCAIERFLVVGEGGLAATLKRIPHVVTIFSNASGATCVKATQPAGIVKQQLIEADLQYRKEIMKKNAAKAAAAKAKAAAPATDDAPKAAAPAEAKRTAPSDATAADANKKQKNEHESETLARMLVQGVVRVLQNRVKADKGPLPLSELEEEFKALWKVPFNLQQAGETDTVTFLRKWQSKVELIQEGDVFLVQLAKKVADKPKAAEPAAPKVAGATAVKAVASAVKASAPAAAKSLTPPPAAKGISATPPPAVSKPVPEVAGAKNGASIPMRTGAPTRPPVSIEDFLWNIHSVIEAFGGPMPLDMLKDAYQKHLGHKCAIERFLVVGEGGMAATLKRIPHVVTITQDPNADGGVTLKPTMGPGTTKDMLIAEDQKYRKQLQQKIVAAKAQTAVPASSAATATPAKAAAEAPAADGERDPKKARTEDPETLARMLIQGVVRVLQNRQKEGKGALPISDLESEFKALWKVPFNLQQAGESDTVTFLQKWAAKVEVLEVGGQRVVQLAKKAVEKAKATAAKAPPAKSSSDSIAAAPAAAFAAGAGVPAARLAELQQQAQSMHKAMLDLVQKQEAFMQSLRQLSSDSTA